MTQAPSKFDTDGTLIDEATRTVYQTLLDTFVQYIEVFTRPAQPA